MGRQTQKTDQRSSAFLTSYAENDEERKILEEWVEWVGNKLIEGHAVKLPNLGFVTLMRYKGRATYSKHLTWELWKRDKKAFEERRKVQHPNLVTDGYRLGLKFYGIRPYGPLFRGKPLDKFKIRMTESFRQDHEKYKVNWQYLRQVAELGEKFQERH